MNMIVLDFIPRHTFCPDASLLVSCLAAEGHSVCLVTAKAEPLTTGNDIQILRLPLSGFSVYPCPLRGRLQLWRLTRSVMKALRTHMMSRFDLVIALDAPIPARTLIRRLLKGQAVGYLGLQTPVMDGAVEQGVFEGRPWVRRIYQRLEPAFYALFDQIRCTGPAAVAAFTAAHPDVKRAKVGVMPAFYEPAELPCEFDRAAVRTRYGLPQDAVICVYSGPLTENTGLPFLRAVLSYFSRRSDVFFVVTGAGPEAEGFRRYLEEEKSSCARFIPALGSEENLELLRACDIGLTLWAQNAASICPSSALLPYLQLSLPVLAAGDLPDVAEVLEEADCGLAVPQEDPREFLRLLNVLVKSADNRHRLGKNGRRYLESEWSGRAAARRILCELEDTP